MCRIPHRALCPGRTPTAQTGPYIESLRRQLAVRTRRLIDTGRFTPAPPAACESAASNGRLARPVVQLLLGRCLADAPFEAIQCGPRPASATAACSPCSTPAAPEGYGRCCPPALSAGNSPCPPRSWPSTISAACPIVEVCSHGFPFNGLIVRRPFSAAGPSGLRPFECAEAVSGDRRKAD
ncbi:DUF6083 domain-containing protein [Streptomyces sp. NPDC060027]|uniref:DUF6083 domain-containing protein n=1 Tax=Streptomyces sp. NPDC060027 TaxID=3347040 RepID=UPI00367BD4BE